MRAERFKEKLNKTKQLIMIATIFYTLIFILTSCFTENTKEASSTQINITSSQQDTSKKININTPLQDFKKLQLTKVIQSKTMNPKSSSSIYEPAINSPKSVTYTVDGSKFYVNSLEGYTTVVFDAVTLEKLKEIRHQFNASNNSLFKNDENTVFDYKYKQNKTQYNHFLGKPVESCLSHNGKYLWVTYYRRDWDHKAESPSAVAIIDTETDEIVRVMPSGPLPKMIANSPDNKYIAITHWGDNTVGLIDVSSDNPNDFHYTDHLIVDKRLAMNFISNTNRDSNCGNCLRGTVFTPDNQKILIAKMGGNGIAVIDVASKDVIGTITGSYQNLRHLVINNGNLYLGSNKHGVVQKAKLEDIFKQGYDDNKHLNYNNWETVSVGAGVRTIDVTKDGKYIFACVNNESKIAVIDAATMKKIYEIKVASFPVGMSLSPDNKQLTITSQGKSSTPGSGNTVTVFDVIYE